MPINLNLMSLRPLFAVRLSQESVSNDGGMMFCLLS
jgi:hypothetical protein